MTPSKFVQFVSIGFGVTVGIISLAVGMWLLSKRAQQRRRERQQQAAELAAAAAVQQPDPRRRRTENVQRMIAEKRKQAAVARKPFLVVQPGGDAVVAYKEQALPPRASMDGSQGGLIKAHMFVHTSADPTAYAQDMLSRRALVAAAALSGRTTSGISDVLADASEAAAELAEAGEAPGSERQQQRQQQHWHQRDGGSSQAPCEHSLSRQSSLAASVEPLLAGQQPSSSSSGDRAGGSSFPLTRLARHHAAEAAGGDVGNV